MFVQSPTTVSGFGRDATGPTADARSARADTIWSMSRPAPLHFPFATRVVGVASYQDTVRHLVEGADLVVSAEPSNPFDHNAHVVTFDGAVVGYLSRAIAARMAVSGPGPWAATVREVFRRDVWGVEIGVGGPLYVATLNAVASPDGACVPPEPAAAPVNDVAVPASVVVARHTGRHLGAFARHDPTASLVWFTVGGTELSAPAELVEVLEAAVT